MVGFSFIKDLSLPIVVSLRAKAGLVIRETRFSFSRLIGQFVKKLLFHWKKERLDMRGAMAYV